MRLIKISNVPDVVYQFRHWGKWYWILDTGEIVSINKVIKKARVLDGRSTIHNE